MVGGEDAQAFYGLSATGVLVVLWSLPLWVVALLVSHPPWVVGVIAALWSVPILIGAWTSIVGARSPLPKYWPSTANLSLWYCWVAIVCTISMLPAIGLWSASWEPALNKRDQSTASHMLNALWHAGNMIPVVDLPRALNQRDPPIHEWGVLTAGGILIFQLLVVGSLLLLIRLVWQQYLKSQDEADENRT